jgi:superfamily II DNA helicase RecQ
MQHKSPVVAIIDIEAGKSILFILLASISSGVTIIVMLLVILQFNIKEQCN